MKSAPVVDSVTVDENNNNDNNAWCTDGDCNANCNGD